VINSDELSHWMAVNYSPLVFASVMHLHSDLLQLQSTVKTVSGVKLERSWLESIEGFSFSDHMIVAVLAFKRVASRESDRAW